MPAEARHRSIRRPKVGEFVVMRPISRSSPSLRCPWPWPCSWRACWSRTCGSFLFPLLSKQYLGVWRRRPPGVSTHGTVTSVEAGTDSETSWAKVRLDAYDTVVDVSRRRLRVGDRVGIRWHPAEPATAVRLDRTTATLSILILLELVLVAYQMAALVRIGMVIHQALCMALLIGCAVVAITGGVAAATGHS